MTNVKTMQIRSILHSEPMKNLKQTEIFIPYKGRTVGFSMNNQISKHFPDRFIRKFLQTHFGVEPKDFALFNLDDKTIDKDIDLIMSLPICLEINSIEPAQLNLFKSPLFPKLSVMKNPYNKPFRGIIR